MSLPSNIALIGMPGSGKSTIGVLLAKRLAKSFLDTDIRIQERIGESLQAKLDRDGYLELRKVEEQVLLDLDCQNTVISTGGSAVYSEEGMRHLLSIAAVVFLSVDRLELLRRIDDMDTRGIAAAPGTSFEDLFAERVRLYTQYEQVTIEYNGQSADQICSQIIAGLSELNS